jgi:glucokinase-like ROK family protein
MSYPSLGTSIKKVRSSNLRAVLLGLLHHGRISRVQLAHLTNLSTTTITNLISDLISEGIVLEEGSFDTSGQRSVGRPRTSLTLIPNARFSFGVHIGVGLFRVALINLCAEIVTSRMVKFDLSQPAFIILEQISDTVKNILLEFASPKSRIVGIGVGASGLVNYQCGVNILAPNLGWKDIPIRDFLQSKLNFPVVVDNNVRAMALGEAYFGAGKNVNSLAFVYGRVGVGAGFVVGKQIYRGSSAGAGEIGHMIMIPKGGNICRCGQSGCLETLISEPVLLNEARQLMIDYPNSLLAQIINQPGEEQPIDRLFQAARTGDQHIRQILAERGCYLGIALANLVNILNPDIILLGGMFAQGYDLLIPSAEEKMRSVAFAGLGEKVVLQMTSFGWRAGVIGAATLALTEFFYEQPEVNG